MICDTLFAQIGDENTSVMPASFQGKEGRTSMMIAGAVVAALLSVWTSLAIEPHGLTRLTR
jgi:hypothetical protein